MAPVGILSLAAVLRQNGHEVRLIDAGMQWKVLNDEWVKRIAAWKPDLAGFSATTSSFMDAVRVARGVKQTDPGIKTVVGGVHASWGKGPLLEKYPEFDYLIDGEGEDALTRLASGESPKSIEGLFYQSAQGVKNGPERLNLLAMDELPFPAYDLLEGFPKEFPLPLFSYPRYPAATVISSRGCVYRCEYCDRSVFHKSFRWNSPEYTMEHIGKLSRDFGVKHINFYDDLFTLNRDRVARLCGLLRDSGRKVTFNCIVRIGHIDRDLIDELKSAGCWMVNVGIESGDQAILDAQKEGLSLADISRDVNFLHDSGLWVKGLFMMGFPGETVGGIAKTREFAKSLPLKDANCTAFTPYPGAPIYQRIRELGTFDEDWEKMDCMRFVFVPNEIGSREILEENYNRFFREFYNRPFMRGVWRKMMVQSPHSYWRFLKDAPRFVGYAMRNFYRK
jgi:radical SAM superfamily enzyme YgiQ (UPF0313 family)